MFFLRHTTTGDTSMVIRNPTGITAHPTGMTPPLDILLCGTGHPPSTITEKSTFPYPAEATLELLEERITTSSGWFVIACTQAGSCTGYLTG